MMTESKSDFRKALNAIVDVRARDTSRPADHRRQHLLIGALTRRP